MKYYFKEIVNCQMCGDFTCNHKVLGQRLNKSQGYSIKKKVGISVSVLKCSNCGLIYSNPQPIPFSIQDHYNINPNEYWKEEYFIIKNDYFFKQIEIVKKLLNFRVGMKALDIGAGIGKGMIALNNAGFDTYGVEPSESFYKLAVEKMKIDNSRIIFSKLEELDFEPETFDFINFGAVFEHVYEPDKCLEKALKLLKPNGIIHIEVPSSKWLISKLANVYFKFIGTNFVSNLSPMHPPYHLHEFDIDLFKKVSNKYGYAVEKYYMEICTLYNVPNILKSLLRFYMGKTNTGMQLVLYIRKLA